MEHSPISLANVQSVMVIPKSKSSLEKKKDEKKKKKSSGFEQLLQNSIQNSSPETIEFETIGYTKNAERLHTHYESKEYK